MLNRDRVLQMLRDNPNGITTWDMPRGFALSQRVGDLKRAGYEINSIPEKNESGRGIHARYVLISEPAPRIPAQPQQSLAL